MPIYAPGQTWNPGEFASILAIGDSWFWYPKNNLLQALSEHPQLKDPYRNIQLLGFNGAKISEYVDRNNARGKYARAFKRELNPQNSQFYVAVMISGGGNDAVDYGLALRSDCSGLTRAEDCIDPDGMDGLLKDISGALGLLIHDVLWEFHKQRRPVDIFLHGYDYPVPDGRGFDALIFKLAGPWLASAMDEVRVPSDPVLRKQVCRILIDRVNDTFAMFARPADGVHCVDCRNVLRSDAQYLDDWANELHPTFDGFDKLVEQRWIPLLRQLGYAS
jgi:hypothetical protein